MSAGYIKLFRQMTEWEWYKDANTKAVFLHLLLMANHAPAKWRGIQIERGQHLTSIKKLAADLGISPRNARTALHHLEKTGELTIKTTNKWTLVTIENYGLYQGGALEGDKQSGKQATNKRQASDKQATTNKKDKKDKKEKNDSLRKVNKRRIKPEVLESSFEGEARRMSEAEAMAFRATAHDEFLKFKKERTVQ